MMWCGSSAVPSCVHKWLSLHKTFEVGDAGRSLFQLSLTDPSLKQHAALRLHIIAMRVSTTAYRHPLPLSKEERKKMMLELYMTVRLAALFAHAIIYFCMITLLLFGKRRLLCVNIT